MSHSSRAEQLRPTTLATVAIVLVYHALAALAVVVWCSLMGHPSLEPRSLLRFDALHYQWISQHGYEGFRQAFFPLFPLTWRFMGTEIMSAIILNGCLYFLSLILLARTLSSDIRTLLVWCTLPSTVFFFAPYTEALFAMGAVILLLGTRYDLRIATCVGMFICTLSRPAFTALAPAAIGAIWLSRKGWRPLLASTLPLLTGTIIGLVVVLIVQHAETGSWFGFFHAQAGWGNEFVTPSFPLRSWGGGPVVMLDAAALLFGIAGLGFLLMQAKHRFLGRISPSPPVLLISVGYVSFISLIILLLHKGELYSLNRFIFATPFFLVIVEHWFRSHHRFSRTEVTWGILLMSLFFLLFGSYVHIQTFLKFSGLALFISLGVSVGSDLSERHRYLMPIYLVFAFCIQLYFAIRFLDGGWVA